MSILDMNDIRLIPADLLKSLGFQQTGPHNFVKQGIFSEIFIDIDEDSIIHCQYFNSWGHYTNGYCKFWDCGELMEFLCTIF